MLVLLLFTVHYSLSTAFPQQPQAQAGQELYPVNAKYVQGFGPGYWPTAGANLILNLAPGTAVCSSVIRTYAGGTLTLAPSATNYVYLDTTNNCVPASNTTGFTSAAIPIATVATSGSAITSVTDVRTMFVSSPSSGNAFGMGNGSTVIDATLPTYAGADMGASIANALAAAYARGGATVDARGFQCPTYCHIGTANLVVGDGTHPIDLKLPAGTITRDIIPSTGKSAQIIYNSYATIEAPSLAATTIVGPSDVTAVQQGTSGPSNVHLSGFNIGDTGSVVSGSAALQIGGPTTGFPGTSPATSATPGQIGTYFASAGGGYAGYWTGRLAHTAIYNKVLTPTQIANHYTVGSSGSGYEAVVTADGPISYWPLKETSGITAYDLVGLRNGTYTGGVTLGSAAGIPGDAGTYAALFGGVDGYVALPSYTWFPGGDFSLDGWAYSTIEPGPFQDLLNIGDSPGNDWVTIGQAPDNGAGFYFYTVKGGNGTDASDSQMNMGQGAWHYWAVTYNSVLGLDLIYWDGVLIRMGSDVTSSTFENLSVGGADIGLLMDSAHGCICYNQLNNVSGSGQSYGWLSENHSGYPFGVNQNQSYGGRFSASSSGTAVTGMTLHSGGGGSGWNYGDYFTVNGGTVSAVGQVTAVNSGAATQVTLTFPGLGYATGSAQATTAVSPETGIGLTVDITAGGWGLVETGTDLNYHHQPDFENVGGPAFGLFGNAATIDSPYIEASGAPYMCGSFNTFLGSLAPNYCTSPSTSYGGPVTDLVYGQGQGAQTWGVQQYILLGAAAGMADVGNGGWATLDYQGVKWSKSAGYTGGGLYGHANWDVGMLQSYSGIKAHGLTTLSAIADPAAPALSCLPAPCSGSTTLHYWIVGHDWNNGVTNVSPEATITDAPDTLSLSNKVCLSWLATDGILKWDILKGSTSASLATNQSPTIPVGTSTLTYCDSGGSTGSYSVPARNTTADISGVGNLSINGNLYLQNPFIFTSGAGFVDVNSAGPIAFGYNTPKGSTGGLGFQVFNNSTDYKKLFYTTSAGTSSGTDGVFTLSNTLDDGSGNSTFRTITSNVATGTPPLSVSSTTPVANLSIGGNAATASAAASAGTECSSGSYARGVDASWNAKDCTAAATGTVTASGTPAQYDFPYWTTATNLTKVTAPTTNGVWQPVWNVTGSAAVAPTITMRGVPVDATNPATLLYSDRASYLNWTSGTALALPAVASNFAYNFPFVIQNNSTTLTITPNAGASDLIDEASSGTLIPKFAALVYQDSTTAPGHWFTVKFPTFAAFGSTCANPIAWSTTAGFSCLAGTSGGVPYFSASNTWASSGALTQYALTLGGGAGNAPYSLSSLGTTTTVLHGNASGNPSYGATVDGDISGQIGLAHGGTNVDLSAQGGTVNTSGAQLLHQNASHVVSASALVTQDMPTAHITRTIALSDLAPVAADDGLILVIDPATAIHLTRFACGVQGTTGVVANLVKSSTSLLADQTCTAGTVEQVNTTTWANGSSQCGGTSSCAIAAHTPVTLHVGTVSGSPTALQVSVDYTVD